MTTTDQHRQMAQIFNLPYRRIAFGWASDRQSGLENSHARQIANLRYSRVQLCATESCGPDSPLGSRRAFTLIELMLVMALLTIVISVAAPSLSRFFHGRVIDSEARRLLALTRAGQSRAVSEGVPMVLWLDEKNGTCGLESESGYNETDVRAQEFVIDRQLTMETVKPITTQRGTAISGGMNASSGTLMSKARQRNLPEIRFQPDGSIGESSLRAVRLIGHDEETLYVARSRNRLNYEIRNQLEEPVLGGP